MKGRRLLSPSSPNDQRQTRQKNQHPFRNVRPNKRVISCTPRHHSLNIYAKAVHDPGEARQRQQNTHDHHEIIHLASAWPGNESLFILSPERFMRRAYPRSESPLNSGHMSDGLGSKHFDKSRSIATPR